MIYSLVELHCVPRQKNSQWNASCPKKLVPPIIDDGDASLPFVDATLHIKKTHRHSCARFLNFFFMREGGSVAPPPKKRKWVEKKPLAADVSYITEIVSFIALYIIYIYMCINALCNTGVRWEGSSIVVKSSSKKCLIGLETCAVVRSRRKKRPLIAVTQETPLKKKIEMYKCDNRHGVVFLPFFILFYSATSLEVKKKVQKAKGDEPKAQVFGG